MRLPGLLFGTTIFVGAALVFLVQPMVAKQLLPVFGGTPGVWNTAVVFFQAALLVGYALAHVSIRALGVRRQVLAQLAFALVVLAWLPFAVREEPAPGGVPPALWIGGLLAVGVGVPYLAVSMASPVLQRWYAELGGPAGREPYFLYVASNAGSLVGLLAFPLVVEPRLDGSGQAWLWAGCYAVFVAGLVACGVLVRRGGVGVVDASAAAVEAAPIGWWRGLRWVLVAALPASLMLGVTTYLTTDIASVPLLWVVPLALYLVSFMVTFGRRVHVRPVVAGVGLAACVTALALVELGAVPAGIRVTVGLHLAAVFLAAVTAHGVLYRDRPPASQLTAFYLLLSLGGVIGGAFTALVAPATFELVVEYPLLLGVALLVRPPLWRPARVRVARVASVAELLLALAIVPLVAAWHLGKDLPGSQLRPSWLAIAIVVVLAALTLRRYGLALAATGLLAIVPVDQATSVLHTERNFFGVLRVQEGIDGTHELLHGTTLHGSQFTDPDLSDTPTSYYTNAGPVGDMFEHLQRDEPFVSIGAVGLGTGSLLAHARLWQQFTFYEIDPAVVRVARDRRYFTYVPDADVQVRVVEGDARLELEDAKDASYDLLVLDAYSSDAVPTHLLTTEAFELYLDKLKPGGRLVFHVSSRHLELEPVVGANVRELGMVAMTRDDPGLTDEHRAADGTSSRWIVAARTPEPLAPLQALDTWRPVHQPRDQRPWTDDFSNVASTITWLPGHD